MIWAAGHLLKSGTYKVRNRYRSGGFGLTYLVEDCRSSRQLILKTPNEELRSEEDYKRFIRRFENEAKALRKISHPNVVKLIEIFQEAGKPCLVMEYVEGETLKDYIQRKGFLSQDEALQYFRKLADALKFLHAKELTHCDVHPGNIILQQLTAFNPIPIFAKQPREVASFYNFTLQQEHESIHEPVLIDFGSAKSIRPNTLTVTTTVNDHYTPYEQGEGGDAQAAWDVYAVAATMYFAVTGKKPITARTRKIFSKELESPRRHNPKLSNWLENAILRGMALEAMDRPQSIQAWIYLLNQNLQEPFFDMVSPLAILPLRTPNIINNPLLAINQPRLIYPQNQPNPHLPNPNILIRQPSILPLRTPNIINNPLLEINQPNPLKIPLNSPLVNSNLLNRQSLIVSRNSSSGLWLENLVAGLFWPFLLIGVVTLWQMKKLPNPQSQPQTPSSVNISPK
jgi:serine/threonine protein kinase